LVVLALMKSFCGSSVSCILTLVDVLHNFLACLNVTKT
jgi:hypothetical protein